MGIAEKIKRLTRLHNKTALARAANINVDSLRLLIAGRVDPTRGTVSRLASALEVDAGWLMDDGRDWPPVKMDAPRGEPAHAA